MADNKKYYYLKLKEDFFESEEMVILESMPDGYLYSNILLKLYLKSLKNEGRLMYKNFIPYTPSVLASLVRHPIGVVEKALQVFQQLGLIEVLDNGAIYMLDIQNFVGESSTEADRKRDYRRRIEAERANAIEGVGTNVRTNVAEIAGQMSGQISDECPDKNPPEIRDKSIENRDREYISCSSTESDGAKETVPDAKKQREKEASEMFERLWSRYPRKAGKNSVKKTRKLELLQIGEDELSRALDRFVQDMQGRDPEYIPYGSTWFNGGYVDYLDANYQPPTQRQSKLKPSARSQMTKYRTPEEEASLEAWIKSREE